MGRLEDKVVDLIEREYIVDTDVLRLRCQRDLHYTQVSKEEIRRIKREYKVRRFGMANRQITRSRVQAYQCFDSGKGLKETLRITGADRMDIILQYKDEWDGIRYLRMVEEEKKKEKAATHQYGTGAVFGYWTDESQIWKTT